MNNSVLATIMIVFIEAVVIVLFSMLLNRWVTKSKKLLPIIFYWIFGIIFVLALSDNLTLQLISIVTNLIGKQFLAIRYSYMIAFLIGMAVYIFTGGWLYNKRLKLIRAKSL